MIPAAVVMIAFLLSNMPSPIYPLWHAQMGFPTSTITVLFSLYQAGVLIGLLGLGRIADRLGWRVSLVSATLLSMTAALAFSTAAAPWQLMMARLISGLAAGIFVSCGPAAVTAVLERAGHKRPSLVASLAISCGLAFGPLLGGLFADFSVAPTQYVFLAEAALLGIGAVALLKDTNLNISRTVNPVSRSVTPNENMPIKERKSLFVVVTIVFTSCYITSGIYMSIGSSYLQQTLGVDSATLAGLLVFLVFGSAFVGQLIFARTNPMIQASMALSAGGVGAIILVIGILTHSPAALFTSAVLSGSSQGLGQLVGLTIVRRITPLHQLRGSYAVLNTVGYGVSGGSIAASWPLFGLLGTSGAILVIAGSVVVLTLVSGSLIISNRNRMG